MRRIVTGTLLFITVFGLCCFTCPAQNGPTPPIVSLTWTQSVTAGVTANCIYRGTAVGVYASTALFCSSTPIVAWVDNTLTSANRGTTFHYAVTAKFSPTTESGYSNDGAAPIPILSPPTLNLPVESGENQDPTKNKSPDVIAGVITPLWTANPDMSPGGLEVIVYPGHDTIAKN